MRKAVLVIVLVAASFAGGAVVNGPGLGWARARFLNGPTLGDRDDMVEVVVDAPSAVTPAVDPVAGAGIPEAPAAPLALDDRARPKSDAPAPPAESHDEPATAPPGPQPPATEAPATPPGPTAPTTVAPTGAPPLTGPTEAEVPAPPTASAPGAETETHGWPDAPGSAPAHAALPRDHATEPPPRDPAVSRTALGPDGAPGPTSPSATPPTPLAATNGSGWAGIAQRMRTLRVSRYWVEGPAAGPVRFRCLVPLTGGQAVGQQFEAEADDPIQAAETALRRVALWQATELESAAPTRSAPSPNPDPNAEVPATDPTPAPQAPQIDPFASVDGTRPTSAPGVVRPIAPPSIARPPAVGTPIARNPRGG